MLAQPKENMTKCSHKTERELQLMWFAALALFEAALALFEARNEDICKRQGQQYNVISLIQCLYHLSRIQQRFSSFAFST